MNDGCNLDLDWIICFETNWERNHILNELSPPFSFMTTSLLSIHPHSLNFASVVVYNMSMTVTVMTKTMGVFEVVLLLSQKKVMVKPSVAACGFPSILGDSAKQQQEVQEGIKSGKDRVTQKRVASCPELHSHRNITSLSLYRGGLCVEGFSNEDCLCLASLCWFPMQ